MRMLNKIFIVIFFLLTLLPLVFSANQTIGSDSSVGAAQGEIILDGEDNKIANYALMDGGLILKDEQTTCSWYSTFPIKKKLKLNSGKLFLFRDLYVTNSTCFFSDGFIDSNDNDFIISPDIKSFKGATANLELEEPVNSIDWSFDSNYFAVGTNKSSNSSLRTYSYNGSAINFTGAYVNDLPTALSVRFRPPGFYNNIYQLGMGEVSGGSSYYECRVLYLDPTNGVSLAGGRIYDPDSTRAVAWYPDGTYLAFGNDNSVLKILNVPANGDISGSTEISATGGATTATQFANDALSWSSSHNNIAAAFDNILEIYTFNIGNSLLYAAKDNLGVPTSYVDWHPTLNYIAVGLKNTSDNVRLYEFTYTTSTLTEKTSGRIPEYEDVNALDWSPDGKRLAVATNSDAGENLKIYSFDSNSKSFRLERTLGCNSVINTVRWSPDGNYLAWGGDDNNVYIFNFNNLKKLRFKNSNIFFKGDFNINIPIEFEGICSIDCNENILNINHGGEFIIKNDSTLKLRNIFLENLKNNNVNCVNDSGILDIQNSTLMVTDHYNFGTGSIIFSGDVNISGISEFGYSSKVTSTIKLNSNLYFSNGITFSYAPKNSKNNLIYMTGKTSKIFFDGSTLVTSNTGLSLIRGSLILDNKVTFSNHGTSLSEAIVWGDGVYSNDLDVYVLSDANLNFYGAFLYENVN